MVTLVAAREAFGKTLVELGHEDPRIVVLGADLNKSTGAWAFGQEFPDRFFDLGIAEQNMTSIAAGLASEGKVPFVTTFAVFGTGRAYDQLRISVAQPHLNVKLVTTHAGLMTGEDGMSAQSVEDVALVCALPGFTVIVPADAPEAVAATRAIAAMEGPCYIRLSRPATPVVHDDGMDFKIGAAELMRDGSDVTIAACGTMVGPALEAADTLASEGVSARVLNVSTLAPVDEPALIRAARETGAVVTAEEHYLRGGLNSIVSQVLGAHAPVPIEAVAIHRYGESGKPQELLDRHGLTPANIADAARRATARHQG